MPENPLPITSLNDFVFCPVSIYFHSLDIDTDNISLQDHYQIDGSAAHTAIDTGAYSTKKAVLQGLSVYSEKYCVFGKIDVFDEEKGLLTERKKKIVQIYDGYVFQVYAQYFALTEMGYIVRKICLYSMDDNKNYDIPLPENDKEMMRKFEKVIKDVNEFSFDDFVQDNCQKCAHCIYATLCSYAIKE